MIERPNDTQARCKMLPQTILEVIARDHIDDLRREARQARRARLAAKARRQVIRRPRSA